MLSGSIAVDESILTGESLPQFKNPVQLNRLEETFLIKNFKSSVIFAGTDIVSVSATEKE